MVIIVNSNRFRLIYTRNCIRVVSESESALSCRMVNVTYRTRTHSSRMRTARFLPYVREGSLSRESLSRGSLSRETLSWGSLSRRVSVQGDLYPGGSLSRGVSVQRVSVSTFLSRETPRTVARGRYASYWNTFLLSLNSVKTLRENSII